MDEPRADDLNQPPNDAGVPQPGTEEPRGDTSGGTDTTDGPGNVSIDEPTEAEGLDEVWEQAAPDPEPRLHEDGAEPS